MPALATVLAVDRRANLSHAEFVREYRTPNRPVILTDATNHWPALGTFTPEFFRAKHGHRRVKIGDHTYTLGEFIDLLSASTADKPAPYPCKLDLRGEYADLVPDVSPRYDLSFPDRTHSRLLARRFIGGLDDLEIFVGGPGGEFPYLHYDYLGLYAYINMVYGEKEFIIFPPDQAPHLYIDEQSSWRSRVANVFQPDFDRYPDLANAASVVEVLGPGETLFIPCGWWHSARSKTVSISVAFDQLCASNWSFFTRECLDFRRAAGLKAALIRGYLGVVGAALSAGERLRGWR
jgi:hypothetical protein